MRFGKYVLNQCKKAGTKLSALTRICNFMSLERRRTLMKSFIESQYGYCPYVWMFCGRKLNKRINHLHERTLLKIYLAKIAQCLSSIEIFPHLQLKYAKLRIICQLRSQTDFSLHSVNTIAYGLKSLKYFAGKVWSIVAFEIRNATSLK